MTGKSAFSEEEWHTVAQGPPVAGLLVITARHGGSFRESFALAKAYAEARQQHGESELLDEIVSAKPDVDRHRYGSPEKLQEEGPKDLSNAVAVLHSKAAQEEVEDYRNFVLALAKRVAAAHKEEGQSVSPAEQEVIDRIAESLGAQAP
jgi:hypothetical protein